MCAVKVLVWEPLIDDDGLQGSPSVSPNGDWIASTLMPGTPEVYLEIAYPETGSRRWDIAPDGTRFPMIRQGALNADSGRAPRIVVVQNWTEELRRLVPVN